MSAGAGRSRFLPPDPKVEETFRMTPQLALRIAILGGLSLVLFGVLLLRLWSLQVLSGPRYLASAQNNQLRTQRVEAPRGPILDREGRVLVDNRAGTAIQLWPADLPETASARQALLARLGAIVHEPLHGLERLVAAAKSDPLSPITVKESVHEDQVAYIYEHADEFPGVRIAQTYLRHYNAEALAAQILGYVGEISPEQLKLLRKDGYVGGDKIGQAGVEFAFDSYLRGTPGEAELRVDSLGRPRSEVTPRRQPGAGNAIRLTIDIALQRAAERALTFGIRLAHTQHQWAANGGAIVALDPRTGEVLALASNPTYKPSVYVGRANRQRLAPLLDPDTARRANYPGLNRALVGLYPPGSTFKPVTALAAMQEHLVQPYQTLPCTGEYTVHGQRFNNWDPYVDRPMTLPAALEASCDTYFYQLGYDFYGLPPDRGHPLQAWASRFGFGAATGIDIGPEQKGLLPTPEWRQSSYTKASDPCCWQVDRLWKPGDSIQLAIGQKDLLVTPLQMARFYALVANGGKLVTPYVVQDAEQPASDQAPDRVLRRFAPPPPVSVGVDPGALAVVRDGLYQATHGPDGTATGVFGSLPVPISGKTGTAEKVVDLPGFKGIMNQSWFCGYGPSNDPKLVVCTVIENGGHGGDAAAPATLKVFEQFFRASASSVTIGKSD